MAWKRMSKAERVKVQGAFLQRYLACGTFYRAAKKAGTAETSVRNWLRKDVKFARAFAAVKEAFVERLEMEADRRGVRGVPRMRFYQGKPIVDPGTGKPLVEMEYSDQLLMFRLRALKPTVYRDRLAEVGEMGPGVKLYRGVDTEKV
jgi:hypothetical protein